MKGPETCPNCGHDPTGDDNSLRSGGGWVFDNEVFDGIFAEIYRCPACREEVHREQKELDRSQRP